MKPDEGPTILYTIFVSVICVNQECHHRGVQNLAASRYCGHMSQGRWQGNLVYSLVDEAEHHGAGGKQSPNSSDKLSPKMVGGKQ